MTKQQRFERQLNEIINQHPHSLKAAVATEALDYGDAIESFFSDLLNHGCQSGMVGALIYYHDTHQFYDRHYEEIEALRFEMEEAFGMPLQPKGDLKNWFAWMAFEETGRFLADELQLCI